ncbi:type II toxin-antitoxin system toxin DNA ADP-ribosyl transferase DarT [Luteococcus sp. Sow4_B9]|uniref:type II toxin-antitoxin system toxin DNA ADP-ribosyl transferase DarT n=1 Tax=Luteococcus sp. Sow4_B9 TaxID=3438792 RepID=UPI003F9E35A2
MTRPVPTPVYHFTRIEHLPTIVRDGLLPDNAAQAKVLRHEIGNKDIKAARRRKAVPCGNKGFVADYVPFYFAPRSPMMYSIASGNVEGVDPDTTNLVYLCSTTQRLQASGHSVVYTNQNARAQFAEMTTDDGALETDDFVDWRLMRAKMWKDDPDKDPNRKNRRQAECLVQPHVEWDLIEEVVTKTRGAHDRTKAILEAAGVETPIFVRPTWYF